MFVFVRARARRLALCFLSLPPRLRSSETFLQSHRCFRNRLRPLQHRRQPAPRIALPNAVSKCEICKCGRANNADLATVARCSVDSIFRHERRSDILHFGPGRRGKTCHSPLFPTFLSEMHSGLIKFARSYAIRAAGDDVTTTRLGADRRACKHRR